MVGRMQQLPRVRGAWITRSYCIRGRMAARPGVLCKWLQAKGTGYHVCKIGASNSIYAGTRAARQDQNVQRPGWWPHGSRMDEWQRSLEVR